jgi:hypothetical protein
VYILDAKVVIILVKFGHDLVFILRIHHLRQQLFYCWRPDYVSKMTSCFSLADWSRLSRIESNKKGKQAGRPGMQGAPCQNEKTHVNLK